MNPPVLKMERGQHSSRMLVSHPATSTHAKQESDEEVVYLDAIDEPVKKPSPRPPIPKRKTNTHLTMESNKEIATRKGFSWKALVFVFVFGFGVATLLTVFFDLTPTGKAVKRLSAVNLDMTESYKASTVSFSRQLKILDAKIDRLLGDVDDQESFVEPKPKEIFDPTDVAICGFKGDVPQICSPSGNWKWDPPLEYDEWSMCKGDDGTEIPCDFHRQPKPVE